MKLWKIMQRSLGAALAVVAADFSRYQVILEREPFGEVAPPAVAETVAPAASETFAKDYELKSIIEDGNRLRVGILNKKTSKHIYLNIGQELEGLQLVTADYESEEAVLKIGLETITIKLHPDKGTNKTPTDAATTPRQPLFGSLGAPEGEGGARKPFFADMKRRGASPFQRLGGTNAPFPTKGLESFFKPNTNMTAPFFSPFRPQGSPFKPSAPGEATWPQTSAPPFPFAPFGAPAAGGAVSQPSGAEPQPTAPAYYPPPQMPFEMPVEGEEIEEDLE